MKHDRFLLFAALAQFALFIPVTLWANTHRHPPLEIALTHLVQKKQSRLQRRIVQTFDIAFCSSFITNILVVPIAVFFWRRQRRAEAIATLATCWLSEGVRKLIKRGVHRPRPRQPFVHVTKPRLGSSFPSGDVASSVGLWGWLFALGLRSKQAGQSANTLLLSIPALFIAFIGPARVYLGDHWATDVLGGYLFGGGWLSLSLYVYLAYQRYQHQSHLPTHTYSPDETPPGHV